MTLRYGRISSELRDAAEHAGDWLQDNISVYGQAAISDYEQGDELGYVWVKVRYADLQRSLFLLILAEAVADEGM